MHRRGTAELHTSFSEPPRSPNVAPTRLLKLKGSIFPPEGKTWGKSEKKHLQFFLVMSSYIHGQTSQFHENWCFYSAFKEAVNFSNILCSTSVWLEPATTSKKISFFLCLMPSDRQDLSWLCITLFLLGGGNWDLVVVSVHWWSPGHKLRTIQVKTVTLVAVQNGWIKWHHLKTAHC